MKAILQNSLLVRAVLRLREWYHEGAIAGFFRAIAHAYPHSRFRQIWEHFCAAPICTAENSRYARILAALRRFVERLGDAAEAASLARTLGKVWQRSPGQGLYAITADAEFEQHFGKKAARRRKIYNGMIPCQVYMYY